MLPRNLLSLDLGWRNIVFALRTALAAIGALAIAYWLELSDPQWATLTVFVLAQPTAGAAMAKGLWRAVGTVCGGAFGLVLVGLFSQAAELLVAATALMIGAGFYVGAKLRNFASYGVLLGSYTALLVAYEGSTDPLNAWTIAADRTAEILIGIACITVVSTIVFPRYAGDALHNALQHTLEGLTRYVATALHLTAPMSVFAQMRGRMVSEVVSFDALRSSAMFEAPEMRADQGRLRRIVREFLIVLSSARALYMRLDAFDKDDVEAVHARLRPTLEAIAGRLEQIAAEPGGWRDMRRLRRDLAAARVALRTTATELEGLVGTVPFDPLANGVLIVNRVREMLHGLAMVFAAEAAGLGGTSASKPLRRRARASAAERKEALLVAIRAGIAILVLSALWLVTGWNEGFTAVSGGAIMLFFGVNQDNPQAGARSYLIWSSLGIALAYLLMVFILPHLEGFTELAIVLVLVLFPAGLMAGTPRTAWSGIALGAFTIAEVGTGNVFAPDESGFVNASVALIAGMLVCLAVIGAMPVNSLSRRGQGWQQAIGTILPAVARGSMPARRGAEDIVATLSGLLPRLALDRRRDEEFFRGSLGAASSAIELGRLAALASDAAMPPDVAVALRQFLERFATALEALARSRADRAQHVAEAEAIVVDMQGGLARLQLESGPPARTILRAGASLRFVADRFTIDRAYLARSFAED